ncbi:PTS sugar transporter subunit IIA [Salibacterium salarium]|uniref:PTS sugar transporter subunit IIA n=1 Tax=Salibacterium salarium TaxID=284579 RepID=A0A428N3T6_9BACI|nr:fructose PTS transporter subunit IIA [Salibacterium salarium]RSL33100.1 PTS sugar transporter subunit IIA [Salibacterium salarium]
MTLKNLLNEEDIFFEESLHTQEEVFQKVAEIAKKQGYIKNKRKVIRGLIEREKISTTGFMDAIAIPHTQLKTIQKPAIIILSNKHGIEWNSMDEKLASFFIALLVPEEEAGTTHLEMLSSLSSMLMEEDYRKELLSGSNATDVYQSLINGFVKE